MNVKVGSVNARSSLVRIGLGLLYSIVWSSSALQPVSASARTTPGAAAGSLQDPTAVVSTHEPETVQVTLSAADTSVSWDSRLPKVGQFNLPVLYLNRNGQVAAKVDRTLNLSLSGISGGTPVELEIVSWHVNRATWENERQVERFLLPDRGCALKEPCAIAWTLDEAVLSDYYRLYVRDGLGNLLWENPNPERPDLAALDTWEVAMDGHTLRVIYARLFEFARGEKARYHRLTPDAVPAFIAGQILPILVDTWHTQFDVWGYGPIHPEWDADKVVEVIFVGRPFALLGGTGTYTASTYEDGSPYPERRIWMQPDHNTLQAYDTLENGFKVLLSHEVHHMAQWNVRLSAGCIERKWVNVFLEAQAAAAVSVQYPELELSREHLAIPDSGYSSAAERYLGSGMETSYAQMETEPGDLYDAALYWRFLYEQFDDMRVLRVALEEMACRPVGNVPGTLASVMDAALARLNSPMSSFEESVVAFSRANYALRLENGRCADGAVDDCVGRYYDPHEMYVAPEPEAVFSLDGTPLDYAGSIPASFGTDLIEISLDGNVQGLTVEIVASSEDARLDVHVWRLSAAGDKLRALTPEPERLPGDCRAGCRYDLSGQELAQADRLAVIVVRVDPNEGIDGAGAYALRCRERKALSRVVKRDRLTL